MQTQYKQRILPGVRRVVVKLGSSVVSTPSGVHHENIGRLVGELARLHEDGYQIIVVTSGARAAGLARLGLARMPTTIPEQQAAAAIGQIALMALYERLFSDFGKHVGQVLLTAGDVEARKRYLNAKHTIDHLLSHAIIPVVNENDSVAVEELKFGDNDRLSALVAGIADADLLVILTDVDGLFAGDPRVATQPLIEVVRDADDALKVVAGPAGAFGTGGMASKLAAARSASHRGIPTVIANGHVPGVLPSIMRADASVGTLVVASDSRISNRKHWIAYGMPLRGSLVLDGGAVTAVARRGGSLLPSGIVSVRGRFEAGDCVGCQDEAGREFARGLVAYDAADCDRIKRLASSKIEATLGYHMGDEVIHRDDLVLLKELDDRSGEPS